MFVAATACVTVRVIGRRKWLVSHTSAPRVAAGFEHRRAAPDLLKNASMILEKVIRTKLEACECFRDSRAGLVGLAQRLLSRRCGFA
jgi:hypothetical protein